MEVSKIPQLNYKSPLIPEVILQHLFLRDEMKYNLGLDFGRGNAYAYKLSYERLKDIAPENQFEQLIDDYIQGFRQGYYEFTEKEIFHVSTKAIGETYPFYSSSLFVYEGVTNENGVWVSEIKTFSRGLENGKTYKAFEVILNNPLKFESYFNSVNEKFKKEKKNEPSLIDNSNAKANEKIIYLKELGILDFLMKKEPFILSTNALANVLSSITGEKSITLQSYLNPMNNPMAGQKNNPVKNQEAVEKVRNQLIELGFKPRT